MAGDRMRKVNEAVREIVSEAVASGLKDPRIGFVTIATVETSPDLRHATVYVSVFGNEEEKAETIAGLSDSRKELQRRIAAQLRMKNTPVLTFEHDNSVDRAMRLTQLMNEGEREFEARATEAGAGAHDNTEESNDSSR